LPRLRTLTVADLTAPRDKRGKPRWRPENAEAVEVLKMPGDLTPKLRASLAERVLDRQVERSEAE
jgi:hypothetical protein